MDKPYTSSSCPALVSAADVAAAFGFALSRVSALLHKDARITSLSGVIDKNKLDYISSWLFLNHSDGNDVDPFAPFIVVLAVLVIAGRALQFVLAVFSVLNPHTRSFCTPTTVSSPWLQILTSYSSTNVACRARTSSLRVIVRRASSVLRLAGMSRVFEVG